MKKLSYLDTKNQSLSVYGQFGEKIWIPYARQNALLSKHKKDDLLNCGMGKFAVMCAMGQSLEKHIDTIKKYRDKIDVFCVDKAFGVLLERGIKADYVVLCDCNIPFSWIEKYIAQTEGVKLLAGAYANTQWTKAWKGDIYFHVNVDAIGTEKKFLPIFHDDIRVIPAGTNVANAMVILATWYDEKQIANFMAYEKYFLVGFDNCFYPDRNYYAWANPKPKRNYLLHRTVLDLNQDVAYTSENLLFSAQWLKQYLDVFKYNVMNCSGQGILETRFRGNLENELKMINPTTVIRDALKLSYKNMQLAKDAFEFAAANFRKTQEALIWQSATME